ncbi:hypothetical protein [Nocardioides pakistanensis]
MTSLIANTPRRLAAAATVAAALVLGPTQAVTAAATSDPLLRKSAVTASPSTSGADLYQPVFLAGKVSGPSRLIQVVEKLPDGWRKVVTGRTRADGTYRVKVPTNWIGAHRYAVAVPATGTFGRAQSVPTVVRVKPGYRAPGSAKSWALSEAYGSIGFRFNPCEAIAYRVNLQGAPRGALKDVHEAVRRVSEATGMRFVFKGGTRYKGWTRHPGRAPKDAGLTFAWAPRRASDYIGGSVGLGGQTKTRAGAQDAAGRDVYLIEQAAVLIASDVRFTPGFGSGPQYGLQGTLGQLLMHETAHAVGLDHVNDRTQIMSPVMSRKPARWGAGDLVALRKVGLAAGCLTERTENNG